MPPCSAVRTSTRQLGEIAPLEPALEQTVKQQATAVAPLRLHGGLVPLAPQSRDFVSLGLAQIRHFRTGASAEAAHPLQRRPGARLRWIEQLTYFGILNVLIPVQVGTGPLMWRATTWASWVDRLGGMRVIASVDTLAAWLFVTSVLVHVYLTMLGRTPLGRIRAMLLGREEQPEVTPKAAAGADQNPRLGATASAGSPVINRTSR
jgi:hypothetical protein